MKFKALTIALLLGLMSASAQAAYVTIDADQAKDDVNNLVWLRNMNTNGAASFSNQTTSAAGLTTGGVSAGTWRRPTLSEWHTLSDPPVPATLALPGLGLAGIGAAGRKSA